MQTGLLSCLASGYHTLSYVILFTGDLSFVLQHMNENTCRGAFRADQEVLYLEYHLANTLGACIPTLCPGFKFVKLLVWCDVISIFFWVQADIYAEIWASSFVYRRMWRKVGKKNHGAHITVSFELITWSEK